MSASVGSVLLARLEKLQKEKGELTIADIGHIISGVTDAIATHQTEENRELYSAIKSIADEISAMKADLSQASLDTHFPDASLELDAIAQSTEDAANRIMDASEKIQSLAAECKDEALHKALLDEATKIFEACNFQDISGQRIRKVIKALKTIEVKVTALMAVFGGEHPEVLLPAPAKAPSDQDLMNGPQHEGVAPTQEEVDRLFNNS